MTGILEMFSELDGREEYQLSLFQWAVRQREQNREAARASMARRYAEDAVYRERHKRASVARTKARYANDPAFRERLKAYQRARYAERRAA